MKSKTSGPMENEQLDTDLIELILDDHVILKKLIKVLKDEDADIGEKYAAFGEFAPLLTEKNISITFFEDYNAS